MADQANYQYNHQLSFQVIPANVYNSSDTSTSFTKVTNSSNQPYYLDLSQARIPNDQFPLDSSSIQLSDTNSDESGFHNSSSTSDSKQRRKSQNKVQHGLSQKEQEILDLRKRNTIAAAKSRQRKAEKMKDLQNEVNRLQQENRDKQMIIERYKSKYQLLRALLKKDDRQKESYQQSHDIKSPQKELSSKNNSMENINPDAQMESENVTISSHNQIYEEGSSFTIHNFNVNNTHSEIINSTPVFNPFIDQGLSNKCPEFDECLYKCYQNHISKIAPPDSLLIPQDESANVSIVTSPLSTSGKLIVESIASMSNLNTYQSRYSWIVKSPVVKTPQMLQ